MMNRRAFVAMILLGCHALSSASPSSPEVRKGAGEEIDRARAMARASGKMVLLMFSADWCAACRQLETMLSDPVTAAALRRHLRLVKVDVSQGTRNHDVARRYGIDLARVGVPALVAIDPQDDLAVPLEIVPSELAAARRAGARALDRYFTQLTDIGC